MVRQSHQHTRYMSGGGGGEGSRETEGGRERGREGENETQPRASDLFGRLQTQQMSFHFAPDSTNMHTQSRAECRQPVGGGRQPAGKPERRPCELIVCRENEKEKKPEDGWRNRSETARRLSSGGRKLQHIWIPQNSSALGISPSLRRRGNPAC